VIPEHEDLGYLVATDTEWYRPVIDWWEEEDKRAFEDEHGVAFCVVEQSGGYGGTCVWGFRKHKPYDLVVKENGDVLYIEEKWHGKYLGIRFSNGELIEYDEWCIPDRDSIPVVINDDGRCEGVINMEGDRCKGRQYHGEFCAGCKKYDDKVKAGKLRECKYCSSTYHSTRSCEQNPKVIEKNAKREAWVAQFKLEYEAKHGVSE